MVNLEYKLQLRAGIDAQRAERVRKRELLEFQRSNPDTELPRELLEVIIDPDIERRRQKEEEEKEEQLHRQLASEESGFVDFADLDYDMIHSASDSSRCPDVALDALALAFAERARIAFAARIVFANRLQAVVWKPTITPTLSEAKSLVTTINGQFVESYVVALVFKDDIENKLLIGSMLELSVKQAPR
ncbi:hypothetical protein VC83_07902 [Pseudogymnoascus destructans]|uniref:Uncharacterized protein n=2 Tax=Pseudogymnoascus destructans TaxID=655981 RepID=L8G2M1_PSED2|nr:uncharacterized protein VC83_07902 [Pseudogymnoascus destructans]ELR06216.1 hypothetical protein GMDG_07871 [Pseudogymnoascus destructans 20631-21]OAF55728.1 hypothetical protein VC83_07902 [Pseudogymnoascus destructans]